MAAARQLFDVYPSLNSITGTTVAIGVLTQAMAALRAADRPTDVASTRVSQSAVPAILSPASKQARADCVEAEHLEIKRKRINGAAFSPSLDGNQRHEAHRAPHKPVQRVTAPTKRPQPANAKPKNQGAELVRIGRFRASESEEMY